MGREELEGVVNDILETELPKIRSHIIHMVTMEAQRSYGNKSIPKIRNSGDFVLGVAYGSILARVESYFKYSLRREMELMERLEFVRIMDQKYKYITDEIQGLKKSSTR